MVRILVHNLLVVRLHEVRDATAPAWVQHRLAVLALLTHHLVVLQLLLLQLVVECLELGTLVGRAGGKDSVDILAEGDLRAETIHLVVV